MLLRGRLFSIVVALAAGGGCAASDPGSAIADLGVGHQSWQPLADGDVVELQLGPQGGRHMLGNVRIEHLWPGEREDGTDAPRVGFTVTDEDGAVWSADVRPMRRSFVVCQAGGFELDFGARVYMVDGAESLDGQSVEMRVDVEDATGAGSSDARRVVVQLVADY